MSMILRITSGSNAFYQPTIWGRTYTASCWLDHSFSFLHGLRRSRPFGDVSFYGYAWEPGFMDSDSFYPEESQS
jgi:hypothetical protein